MQNNILFISPEQTKRRDRTELNCAVVSLGVRVFAISPRRSWTVSYEVQISNHSSVASLGVRGLATGSQQLVHQSYLLPIKLSSCVTCCWMVLNNNTRWSILNSCQSAFVADESLGVRGFVAGYFSYLEFSLVQFDCVAWSAPGFSLSSVLKYSPLNSLWTL